MKHLKDLPAFVPIFIGLCFSLATISCSLDPSSVDYLDPLLLEPEEGIATDITLEIYSDGWGMLLETLTLDTEGYAVIDVAEEEPYWDPPRYYIYGRAEGFYSELYYCSKGQTILVDLDEIPYCPRAMVGTIYCLQTYFADSCLAGQEIEVRGSNDKTASFTTDSQGRYGLGNLPVGDYTFSFIFEGEDILLELSNSKAADYLDLSFYHPVQGDEPYSLPYPGSTADAE